MMNINGYELQMTCGACPEQYDVFKDGKQAGYLRLRHGGFSADYPDCGDDTVFYAEPEGDGIFEDHERLGYLTKAIEAIDARIKEGDKGFKGWFNEDDHDTYNYPEEAMEAAWNEATKQASKRCKEIAQQRYLSENQAVAIDEKISSEFGV